MSADEEYIVFTGGSAQEAEDFIVTVKRRAYSKGKLNDNAWIVNFVSVCFERKALRWYESLDKETQMDWDLLKRAILEEYSELSPPRSIVPTPASALGSSDQWPIPAEDSPFRIGRIRVECEFKSLQGYISSSLDNDYWCTVSQNPNTVATFEFDVSARTIKFQGTTDDYLAANLRDRNWESVKPSNNFAAVVKKNSGRTFLTAGWSTTIQADIWMVKDQDKLVGLWPGEHGVLWELEAAGYTGNNRVYLPQNYQRFAETFGLDYYKPLTLYFETLS